MIQTCADVFAARGEAWNNPNFQFPAARPVRPDPDGLIGAMREPSQVGYEGWARPDCGKRRGPEPVRVASVKPAAAVYPVNSRSADDMRAYHRARRWA